MTIITVISQQPLTTEQVNSFKSVPSGGLDGQVLTKASNNNYDVVWEDAGVSSSTNLSISNKTNITFDILSSTGTDVTLPQATITEAGLLIATDKVKLNSLGTASYLNAPATGNATSGEVVKGDDTRLTDARTPLSHTHAISDVTGLQTALNGKYNNPTGDTTQYVAGDGSLISFPVAGQAGTLVRQVRNETGTTLTKGTVIYLNGASGNKPLAVRAMANSSTTSDRTFGIIQADITNNSNGYCVISGDLTGVDTSALTEGAIVYLSPTVAGGTTTTQPVPPHHSVVLGVVTRSHATQGQFDVSIQNGFELEDIHNVLLTSVANNDVLTYETPTGLWKNKTVVSALGYTPYNATNPNGYTTNTGTVTTASVVSANGFAGSVATAGTTPAITISTTVTGLLKGDGTAISAATAGTDYLTPSGSGASLTGITASQVGAQPLDGDLTALAALTGTNNIYYRSATDTWTPVTIGANLTFSAGTLSASGGGANAVNVTVDFGSSFTDRATTVVTGQTWVSSTSKIIPSILQANIDEAFLLDMKVHISNIVNGDGFTVTVFSEPEAKGTYTVMCLGV